MKKNNNKIEPKPTTVLIGTPALDGRVDAWFANSLHEISKLGVINNIDIRLAIISYESILPMARNDILNIAIENEYDNLVFIDSDVACNPYAFIDIIKNSKDVIAIPTVKKRDDEETYDFWFKDEKQFKTVEGNLQEVEYISTSCLKLSKKALKELDKNSNKIKFRSRTIKNICQYSFEEEGEFVLKIFFCVKN